MSIKDFTQRVAPLKDRLFRFALRMTDQRTLAEDVVQEVLIKLWEKRADLGAIQHLEAWSVRLIRNLSIDKLRSKHQQTTTLPDHYESVAVEPTPQEQLEHREQVQRIHALVQQLPEKQRLVFHLREMEELSYQEIGDALDIPLNQVKVNLFRARQALQQQLRPTWIIND